MDHLVIVARAIHVLMVVLWIGGVALVTTTLLPMLRTLNSQDGVKLFHDAETRFARQSRYTTLLAGASGLFLLWALGGEARLHQADQWWLYPMIIVWILFTLMLFVLEPYLIRNKFLCIALHNPQGTIDKVLLVHRILLALALFAVLAGVSGAHGLF